MYYAAIRKIHSPRTFRFVFPQIIRMEKERLINQVQNPKIILEMPPEELYSYLANTFFRPIPEAIETAQDLQEAGRLLGWYANSYSYLVSLFSFAKLNVRNARKTKNQELIGDAIDKKDMIDNFAQASKQCYAALSRMAALREAAQRELMMSEGKPFHGRPF